MPTIIAKHEVKDTEHWLSPASQREELLGALGARNIRTFVDQRDPSQVAVLMDVDDLDALMGALENPDPVMVAAMQNDGVLPETLTILIES